MAEGKQDPSSGKGQQTGASGASGASAQEKTDKALKDERTESKSSSGQGKSGSDEESKSSSSGSSGSSESSSSKSGGDKDSSGGSQGSSGGDEEVQQPISEEQQREQQQRSELNVGPDSELVRDPSGVMAPKGNAPGPERNREPEISAVDLRPRIEPRDRATFVGAVLMRDDQEQMPDEYNLFQGSDGERDAEVVELDAEPVKHAQLLATNQELVVRVNDQAFVFDREMSSAFLRDARAASTNVVS